METDDFSNFELNPSRSMGRFTKSFIRREFNPLSSRYALSTDSLASFSSQSNLSNFGSSASLLSINDRMSMQDDARSKKITSEVMKQRLYASVINTKSLRSRRLSVATGQGQTQTNEQEEPEIQNWRMVQSMPVTPAHSRNITPRHSPTHTGSRRFHFGGFLSRGVTPVDHENRTILDPPEEDMEVEEDSWRGIASILRPEPRLVAMERDEEVTSSEAGAAPSLGASYASVAAGRPVEHKSFFKRDRDHNFFKTPLSVSKHRRKRAAPAGEPPREPRH